MHMTIRDRIRGFFIALLGLGVVAWKNIEDRLRGR